MHELVSLHKVAGKDDTINIFVARKTNLANAKLYFNSLFIYSSLVNKSVHPGDFVNNNKVSNLLSGILN